ncbi:MAG: phospholipase D family protein [Kineosporiaceae bacterium]|nr:phospholipase D family protein [Kineosporiaceae bacterium]
MTRHDEVLVERAHDALLHAVSEATHTVRLSSPYLGVGVATTLASVAGRSDAVWHLLTDLNAAAVAHGSLSTAGLRALLGAGVSLHHFRGLHAKLYLCDDNFGLVGSANLTAAGLGSSEQANVELSLQLQPRTCREAVVVFDAWWKEAQVITEAEIEQVELAAASLPASVHVTSATTPQGTTSELQVIAGELAVEARTRRLWIKAMYHESPADEPWSLGDWFSSSGPGKPSFLPGDLVLIYPKQLGRCPAVVEVLDESRRDPQFIIDEGLPEGDAERWPWVNHVRPRLAVPGSDGVPLSELGISGKALQRGHRHLGLSEFVEALSYLARAAAG